MGNIRKNKIGFTFYVSRFRVIIFLGIVFLKVLLPSSIEAAILYLIPQNQVVYKNETFVVDVFVDSENETINAVEGLLSFPKNKLEIVEASKGGSILQLWTDEPSYSNEKGEIIFSGGIPQGFQGKGKLLSIIFLAKDSSEKVPIMFLEDSKVLLHDGKGTKALLDFVEGNYQVLEIPEGIPEVFSKSHPDPNKWYKNKTLHIHWDLVEGAEYSFLLSYDAQAMPDEVPDKPEGELVWLGDIEYKDLEDGVYYFHLRQKLPGENWSPRISLRIMIDTKAPKEFIPKIGQDPAVFEGKYFLSFSTTDEKSGIDYYEIFEQRQSLIGTTTEQDWKIAETPYLLQDQTLQSIILIKAVDKAGNERISEIIPAEKPVPWKTIILGLIVLVVIDWTIKRIRKNRKKNKNRET